MTYISKRKREVYMDRKHATILTTVYIFCSFILCDFIVETPVLVFIFGVPIIVMFVIILFLIISIIKNKPVFSINNDCILLGHYQPIKKIYLTDVKAVKLVTFGVNSRFAKDPEHSNAICWYKTLAIYIKNEDQYIDQAKWNWKHRLKKRKKLGIPLVYLQITYFDIHPARLLKMCNQALGNGYKINSDDIVKEPFKQRYWA